MLQRKTQNLKRGSTVSNTDVYQCCSVCLPPAGDGIDLCIVDTQQSDVTFQNNCFSENKNSSVNAEEFI